MTIEYQIDGGAFVDLLSLEASSLNGDESNSPVRVDTNGDGVGDGTQLTDNLQQLSVMDVPISGSMLTLRIRVENLNAGDEDIAIDNILLEATCFAPGSMIATPSGEVRVEDLSIGDLVLTDQGMAVPVRWIGKQTATKRTMGAKMEPVRITKDALAPGVPYRDLVVTANHGMILDGLVINAGALVNGHSIHWVPLDEMPEEITYYHVETENHDVILANGAPAETFVDYVGRKAFDNYDEYPEHYGAERIMPEMLIPRISSARLLPDIVRKRLGIQAADLVPMNDAV